MALDIFGAVQTAGQIGRQQDLAAQTQREDTARKALETYAQSLQTGVPDDKALQAAFLSSPQIATEGLKGIGIVNQLQGREAANYIMPAVSALRSGNLDLAERLTQQRIEQITARGGDPSNTQQVLDLLGQDPRLAQNELLKAGAALGGAGQLSGDQLNALFTTGQDLELGRYKIANTPSGFSVVDSATAQIVSSHTDPTKAEELALKREKQQASLDEAKNKLKEQDAKTLASFTSLDDQLQQVDDLLNHPGRERATGIGSAFPTLPGTEAADFEVKLRQFAGGLALQASEQLTGVLTDEDIKLLKNVESGLDIGLSDQQFYDQLRVIEKKLRVAQARKKKQFPDLFKQHEDIKREAFSDDAFDLKGVSDQDLEKDLGI